LQIQGKFYVQIDKPGDGAKWRRTFGQEIYSPLLIAFTEQVALKKKKILTSLQFYKIVK
jgi:hypothetical protein